MGTLHLLPDLLTVTPSLRTLSNKGGSPCTLANGSSAVGRTVIALGRNDAGQWQVVGATVIDAEGYYSITVNAGSNDRFVILGIAEQGEYWPVYGDITAVEG